LLPPPESIQGRRCFFCDFLEEFREFREFKEFSEFRGQTLLDLKATAGCVTLPDLIRP